MKKILVKILAFTIGVVFIIAMPITSFADEGDLSGKAVNTGALLSPSKTIEEQLLELPESKREEAYIKYYKSEYIDENDDACYSENRDTTWSHLFGIMAYKQDTTYYCVPAACKTCIQYLTGSSPSQSTIASDLGTTVNGTPFGNAITYLNSHQTATIYVSKPGTTNLATMKNDFYDAVVSYNDPPLVGLAFTTNSGWAYDTTGHAMCIGSARNDKEYFKLLDPYIPWVNPNASMYYSKTASSIHSAMSSFGYGYDY